jgi:hypothetical protein
MVLLVIFTSTPSNRIFNKSQLPPMNNTPLIATVLSNQHENKRTNKTLNKKLLSVLFL